MRYLTVLLAAILFIQCDSPTNNDSSANYRISFVSFNLAFTHNSHLGKGFSNPNSAFSPFITFELFLTESSEYTEIENFAIVDDNNVGWEFTKEEVQAAYNSDRNSLIFQDLDLKIFDDLGGKLVKAQFLDENKEVVREKGFNLDNDFPLPALTSVDNENGIEVLFDFYATPYNGGNIPFNVTIYNTYYSSNTFFVTWLNDNNEIVRQDYLDKGNLSSHGSDDWILQLVSDFPPTDATKFYTTFRRGGFTSGGTLNTQILGI